MLSMYICFLYIRGAGSHKFRQFLLSFHTSILNHGKAAFLKMITEFLWLTLLTLNKDEQEALRGRIGEWVKCFLPKLERETTRTEKCRLIASIERHEFGNDLLAISWRFCKFVGNKGILFDENKKQLKRYGELGEFKTTSFQEKILRENQNLKDVYIGRSEIKEESGEWKLTNELSEKLINSGGEAIVFSEIFGDVEFAVRVQIFDPFLFSKKFGADQIKWKTHLISGEFFFSYFCRNCLRFWDCGRQD